MRNDFANRRRMIAEPDNPGALLQAFKDESRVHPNSALNCLSSLSAWDSASDTEKDFAALDIARRLSCFDLKSVRSDCWSCGANKWTCPKCKGTDLGDFFCAHHCMAGWLYKPNEHKIYSFTHSKTGAQFALIPGVMKLDIKPFLISRTVITKGQFHGLDCDGSDLPLVNNKSDDVFDWLRLWGMRLLNVDEWLHACMAGSDSFFPWGDEFDSNYCWSNENAGWCNECAQGVAAPYGGSCVKCKNGIDLVFPRPVTDHDDFTNAFGLPDMVGNVSEMLWGGKAVGGNYTWHESDFTSEPFYRPMGNLARSPVVGFRAAISIPGV